MFELLKELFNFILELGLSLWGLLALVLGFSVELLATLHTTMPRLEGLLVGILLSQLLSRRNKHPLLRALSAPLNLILGVLDLAWDECTGFVKDVYGTVSSWLKGSLGWVWGKVTGFYKGFLKKLKS